MSLINQMLKDLEQRHSHSLDTPNSVLSGLSWSATSPAKLARHFGLWIGIAFILLVVVSISVWQYWPVLSNIRIESTTLDAPQSPLAKTTQAVQLSKSIKSNLAVPTTRPQQTNRVATAKPHKGPDPVSKKISPKQKQSKISANQTPAPVTATQEEMEQDLPATPMEKYQRPLSAKQRATLAYQKGYEYLLNRQPTQAEAEMRNALKFDPAHSKAREMLAGVYIKGGRLVEAGDLLSKGLSISPEHTMFPKLYARILTEQGRVTQAVEVLLRKPPSTQTDPEYHALLAALHQRQGNHIGAVKTYHYLLKQHPGTSLWWLGMAISLEALQKNKEALAAYQRAKTSGNLNARLGEYTNNRLAALNDIGYPAD